MIKNYLIIAWRNLRRHKGFSFINISGLAIGIACCILIFLYINDELSYDKYHANADRIYRPIAYSTIGGETRVFARTPSAIAPGLEEAIPEIEASARLFQFGVLRFNHGDKNYEIPEFYAADPSFFTLFSHEFIAGDPQTALLNPQTLVLSEDTAVQIFGSVDILGKSISVPFQQRNQELQVTGVVKNVPRNSHFRFDIVLSINTFRQRDDNQPAGPDFLNDPIYFNPFSYLLLSESADLAEVEEKIAAVVEEKWGEIYKQEGITRRYPLQALTDIHLKSNFEAEIAQQGDIQYVYIFTVVALMVLFIACFNFINLSTARSAQRAKEVGLRKMFGAQRHQLIRQFLNESSLHAFLGTLIGILLIAVSLPAFNGLSGKEFSLEHLVSAPSIVALFIIIIITGFIAGSFPAFVLSTFQPVKTLRGKLGPAKQSGTFRKILVVFQFSISIFMILGFIVILQQLDYIKNKDLGFNRDHLVVIRGGGQTNDALRDNILKDSNVISASLPLRIPGEFAGDQSYYLPGKDPASSVRASFFAVDYDFIKTFGMEVLWGRDFSREYSTDVNDAVILNETFARRLGLDSDIIGKQIIDVSNPEFQPTVIGVIKDFHHQSLKLSINPMILSLRPQVFAFIAARITPHNVSSTLSHIETFWKEQFPDREFNYYFVDDNYRQRYPEEDKMQDIYLTFGFLAIFIACLGLYGLASFSTEQRAKEVGIRKVLGATVPNITFTLSKDFMKLVLLANIIAWPIGFYVMNNWLDNFAYRIGIEWWVFLAAALIAQIIALITVSHQALKSALTNPAETLQYE
ncbi:MAG: ABC transporter permease [Candidatus Aminicenantes bacterium]|nr:MAG: ABC transporter permease [Candidatus Aminicenantes bacterium]